MDDSPVSVPTDIVSLAAPALKILQGHYIPLREASPEFLLASRETWQRCQQSEQAALLQSISKLFRRQLSARDLASEVTGFVAGIAVLGLVHAFTRLFENPQPLVHVYILPVWIAIWLGSLRSGLTLTLVVAWVLTATHFYGSSFIIFVGHLIGLGLATLLVAYLQNSVHNLQKQAGTDSLTGLNNRHAAAELAPRILQRARRNGQKLAVIVVDINRFKEINDTLGHEMGDKALREASAALRSSARSTDMVARVGGDEFLVLLQNADRRAADKYVGRVRSRLAHAYQELGFVLQISEGIAQLGLDGENLKDLTRVADERMYHKKHSTSERAVVLKLQSEAQSLADRF
ncbi:MAG: diguanylate cyclase [Fimbriimonadaceae bacterium]